MILLPPLSRCVTLRKFVCLLTTFFFFFFLKKNFLPSQFRKNGVKSIEKTNTGEGVKGKRGRTVSDDTDGKSLSDTSTSVCGQSFYV